MTAWIIDDGPLNWLARFLSPDDVATWPMNQFYVPEATATQASEEIAGADRDAARRRALLNLEKPTIQTFSIEMDSEASDILYTHLSQPAGTNANLAENEAIAWSLTERSNTILVTVDKRAAMLALAELGRGRVAHAFDLWLYLREMNLLSSDQFDQLCNATKMSDQSLNNLPLRCQTSPAP